MRLDLIWLLPFILSLQACQSSISVAPSGRSESATQDALRQIESIESLRLLGAECERVTVFPSLARKYVEISKKGDTIFIGYDFKIPFEDASSRIKSHLSPLGWRVQKDGRSGWEDQLELVNERFRIMVSKNIYEDSDYVVGCTDLGEISR